ncbi:MAG: hypothetical protein FWG30_11530, partial [Eubacteriaceae bacterium]|nr:hypothetical protein [Eubacteriaceae bacterium]
HFIKYLDDKKEPIDHILFIHLNSELKEYLSACIGTDMADTGLTIAFVDELKLFCATLQSFCQDEEFVTTVNDFQNRTMASIKKDTFKNQPTAFFIEVSSLKRLLNEKYFEPFKDEIVREQFKNRLNKEIDESYKSMVYGYRNIQTSSKEQDLKTTFKETVFDSINKFIVNTFEKLNISIKSYRLTDSLSAIAQALEIHKESIPIWWAMSKTEINLICDESWEIYNEFISDLFMCIRMQFNAAGYMYFLVYSLISHPINKMQASHWRRAQMVIEMQKQNTKEYQNNFEMLYSTKINEISEKITKITVKHAVNKDEKAITHYFKQRSQKLKYDFLLRAIYGDIQAFQVRGKVADSHKTVDDLWNYFHVDKFVSDNEKSQYTDIAFELFALACFTDFCLEVRLLPSIKNNSKLHDGIWYVYQTFDENKIPLSPILYEPDGNENILDRITAYFNGGGGEFSERSMLEDAVLLIMEMYYQNRIYQASEINQLIK